LKWQDKSQSLFNKCIQVVLLIGTSILLANINPVQWILVCCVLFFSCFLKKSFLLPIVFLISGIPMIFYVTQVFKTVPFTQLALWESWQQIHLSTVNFLQSFGPVVVLATLGLPLFFKKITLARILILVYTIASIALFLSPLSQYAHITNVRFLSAVTVLGEGILAAHFLTRIPIANRNIRRVLTWTLVGALCIVFVPLFILQFHQHANLDIFNSYTYLSSDAAAAYRAAQKLTNDKDIILATWPYDGSFPAVTGRRGFMGHPLLTIDYEKNNHEAYLFFDAQIDDAAMHKFLTDNHITYVLEFTSVIKIIKPFLQVAYQNPLLTLYKVLQ
jgi:hypothetical protein